jgi:hypothetical protein
MKGTPSASPTSCTVAMFGWLSVAVARFTQEPGERLRVVWGSEQLERHLAPQTAVMSPIHNPHSSGAEGAENLVLIEPRALGKGHAVWLRARLYLAICAKAGGGGYDGTADDFGGTRWIAMAHDTLRQTLKSQYHASLAMLRDAVERCPDELWQAPGHVSAFWQVAYHKVSKLEHQLINLRHAQHHTAHLAGRLRAATDQHVKWVGSHPNPVR